MNNHKNNGFSILEIAIILIVLSLLFAGFLGGKHLLKNGKTLKLAQEIQFYTQSIDQFKQSYITLPGDMNTANALWQNALVNSGNGNGIIEYETEGALFWQHLSLAGYTNDIGYSGVFANTPPKSGDAIFGQNMPRSTVYDNAGYFAQANFLQLGVIRQDITHSPPNGNITPVDVAQAIDTKMDDGNAITGNVTTISTTGAACADASGVYSPNTTLRCVIQHVID